MAELIPFEYPPETVFAAEDLYCLDRLTYGAVSKRLGISVPTLKRWGTAHNWREKRREYLEYESQIRVNTLKARAKMLARVAGGDGSAQDAFAAAALENLALKQQELSGQSAPLTAQPVQVESPAQAAALLKEALNFKLAGLLAKPENVNFKAIKDLREAFALASDLEGRADAPRPEFKEGLSSQTEAVLYKLLKEGL